MPGVCAVVQRRPPKPTPQAMVADILGAVENDTARTLRKQGDIGLPDAGAVADEVSRQLLLAKRFPDLLQVLGDKPRANEAPEIAVLLPARTHDGSVHRIG